jgi:hypothetical protein
LACLGLDLEDLKNDDAISFNLKAFTIITNCYENVTRWFFLIDELLFLSDYPKIKIEDLLNSMVILDDNFLELKDIKFSKNELLIKEVETSISRLFEIIRAYQS